ncbi:MAG: hypothetical protein GXP16_07835 [Gammaproteobacteria bacterium]|nr:hypothetical protein [Gammaproteobacteria bacterium]
MSCAIQCGSQGAQRIKSLNETCACMPINRAKVEDAIAGESQELRASLAQRPVLFAGSPVFLCAADVSYIQQLVRCIERVLRTQQFEEIVHRRTGEWSDEVSSRISQGLPTPGLFMGYDFHVTREGPQLIEINTNAGGAFLVQSLYDPVSSMPLCGGHWGGAVDPVWMFEMLVKEWRSAGRSGAPGTLAIVDEAPQTQFLHPEFELARRYFENHGVRVDIADPAEFVLADGQLMLRGEVIDLIYNRITDFYFASPAHKIIRDAWIGDAAVVSPTPAHHARYADKRNLVLLSDPQHPLRDGLSREDNLVLNTIPRTRLVTAKNNANLWQQRKRLFFKPADGFGGRGAYRGAKLTRRVWDEITQQKDGSYVAQEKVQAPSRWVGVSGKALKYDIRAYTSAGEVKLLAARLYQGQTTNFRTPGGGFAPVVLLGDRDDFC